MARSEVDGIQQAVGEGDREGATARWNNESILAREGTSDAEVGEW
jgi:hypothetical protein